MRSALGRGLTLLLLLTLGPAQAHLMVAQRGTLNLVGDGAFVVMAVPVDAFEGADDDGDGLMSQAEMRAHASTLEKQVQSGLQLLDADGPRPLEGLMLNLSPDDRSPTAPARHLVLLGRFALPSEPSQLQLRFTLYGQTRDTERQQITLSRGADKQVLTLSRAHPQGLVLPSTAGVILQGVQLGAEHILLGLDHLLFLLVVLAAVWGRRSVVLLLTAFTGGHAVTLTLSVLGGITLPAELVEPAIAATVVLMASLDLRARRTGRRLSTGAALAAVFGCALIHGLALGNALTALGLDGRHLWASLGGFNLGIEAAQLAVTLAVAGLARLMGALRPLPRLSPLTSWAAIGVGSFWFMQRLSGWA